MINVDVTGGTEAVEDGDEGGRDPTRAARGTFKTDRISFVYLVIVLSNMYIESWFGGDVIG